MVGSGMLRLPLWVEQRRNTVRAHGEAVLAENAVKRMGAPQRLMRERRPQKSRHDLREVGRPR